ncbi:hypothetical protein N7467_009915 [Penicillium canescens]|nr:hypothetical protein N7467_009915 [Penicillium canescens]
MAPVAFQADMETSSEMTNDMLSGCYQYDGKPIQNGDQRPMLDHPALHTNVDQSGYTYQMPIPEVQDVSPKNIKPWYCLLTLSSPQND